MSWLASILITPVLNFAWDKLILIGGLLYTGSINLYSFWSEYFTRKRIVDENLAQAKVVEDIASQITDLVNKGLPVPPELEKRMLDESSKILLGKPINY